MRVYLETERLRLRWLTMDDVNNLTELDSDPEVMRYLSGGPPTPREVIEREILPRCLRASANGDGYGVWAAIERASGAFLGWFSLRPDVASPGTASLGYRLRQDAWGRGYATEGARALLRRAFTELGTERVTATTYQDNRASRRVMEKAGMRFARAFRLTPEDLAAEATYQYSGGEPWDGDDVEYAITRAEWERQDAAS